MSQNLITLLFGVLVLGAVLGSLGTAVFSALRDDKAALAAEQAPPPQDTLALDYLDDAKCSLYFNTELQAWGLMNSENTLLATAPTARSTLLRARATSDFRVSL